MVEEMISTLSQDIRVSIAEDSSVPRNVRSNVVTGLETYLMNEKDDLDLRIYSTISVLEEQINDTNIPQTSNRPILFLFSNISSLSPFVNSNVFDIPLMMCFS